MGNSVLDQISTVLPIYYAGWRNNKEGKIEDCNGVFRFFETERHEGEEYEKHVILENNPIVCVGIIAYWLKHRKSTYVLRNIIHGTHEVPPIFKDLFDSYTAIRFNQFKEKKGDAPETWNWDWEYEFYTKHIIPQELKNNKQTEALFAFITDDDIKSVRSVMSCYIDYLKKCRTDKGYHVSAELMVLRSIANDNVFMLEDIEDFEIIAILDHLESNGCIKVAWNEGHHNYDDAKLLEKGKAHMKFLEEKLKGITTDSTSEDIPVDEISSANSCHERKQTRIDMDRLKKHFTYVFRKEGGGFDTLIDVLNTLRSGKQFAVIACQIYTSKYFTKGDYQTFKAWYSDFCEIVGCKYCDSYKPSKLKPNKEQEHAFLFLNI